MYADDPDLWKTDLAPTGTLRAWLESGKTTAVGSWISEEVIHYYGIFGKVTDFWNVD